MGVPTLQALNPGRRGMGGPGAAWGREDTPGAFRGGGQGGWWERGGQGSTAPLAPPSARPPPLPQRCSAAHIPRSALPATGSCPRAPSHAPARPRSRYLLRQERQCVPRLRGCRGGRLQKVVFGVGAGHGTVRATAVWLPPRDYHHPSGSGQWARLQAGGRAAARALAPSSARHDAARPTGGAGGAESAARAGRRAVARSAPTGSPTTLRIAGPPA